MIWIPKWPEANQLAIYKDSWGFELSTMREQIQLAVRNGLEPLTSGPLDYKPTALTTKPCHLVIIMKMHYFPQEVKYVFLKFIGCCNQTT